MSSFTGNPFMPIGTKNTKFSGNPLKPIEKRKDTSEATAAQEERLAAESKRADRAKALALRNERSDKKEAEANSLLG